MTTKTTSFLFGWGGFFLLFFPEVFTFGLE